MDKQDTFYVVRERVSSDGHRIPGKIIAGGFTEKSETLEALAQVVEPNAKIWRWVPE